MHQLVADSLDMFWIAAVLKQLFDFATDTGLYWGTYTLP